jgi:hypothetical protein
MHASSGLGSIDNADLILHPRSPYRLCMLKLIDNLGSKQAVMITERNQHRGRQ